MTSPSPSHHFSDLLVYLRMGIAHQDRPVSVVLNELDGDKEWELEEVQVPDRQLASLMGHRVTHAAAVGDGEPDGDRRVTVVGNGGVGRIWRGKSYPGFDAVQPELRTLCRAASHAYPRTPLHALVWRYRDVYAAEAVENEQERLVTWPTDPLYGRPVSSWSSHLELPRTSELMDLRLRLEGGIVVPDSGEGRRYVSFIEARLEMTDIHAGVGPLDETPLQMMAALRQWSKVAFWGMLTPKGRRDLRHLFSEEEMEAFGTSFNGEPS
jgi:hypothetical protein